VITKKKLSIAAVILNFNSYQDTIRLVGELQGQTIVENLTIVVVDNLSKNNSYEELVPLEQKYPNVIVLQTGKNLGYAQGNNFGLRYLEII
jgi:GT2 family glycosyltransferase